MSNKENARIAVAKSGAVFIGLEPGHGYMFRLDGCVFSLRATGDLRSVESYTEEIQSLVAFSKKQKNTQENKTMKRNYLNVPGHQVTIEIKGPSGSGKEQIGQIIWDAFRDSGVVLACPALDVLSLTCPTQAQRQEAYLESLDDQQRETLRGHLDALGFDLDKQS